MAGEAANPARGAPILGVAHTRANVRTPAGACDCHVHVFGPNSRFPWWSGRTYTPPDASIEDLLALHAQLGIQRVVVVHPSPYGADNRCSIDAIRVMNAGGRDRARGVAVIDERTTDAQLRDMHEAGVRGVRVNLETTGTHDPAKAGAALEWAAKRVAPLGWHVQTYTNLGVLSALRESILAMPVPLVVDHFGRANASAGVGQPGFDALLALVRSGKVWVKLSAAYRISTLPDRDDAAPIARALLDANPDRMVWGTDWPHPGGSGVTRTDPFAIEAFRPEDDGRALERLAAWTVTPELLRRVLVDNPARLYGFPPISP